MGTAAKTRGGGPMLMSASTLMGDELVNTRGEKLGTLDEIMLDMGSGGVHFAIFVREDKRLTAVPWDALALDPRNKRLVLDVEKEKFAAAPTFDRDHWPRLDRDWEVKVEGFYGRKPAFDILEERWIAGP